MDKVSSQKRSEVMSLVRSKGNRSTELRFRLALVRARLAGWHLHPPDLLGCPDFYFRKHKIAVFIDGCFWHGCNQCLRLPKQNAQYWQQKIAGNIKRDVTISRKLSASGIRVIRIWEHQIKSVQGIELSLKRIISALKQRQPK